MKQLYKQGGGRLVYSLLLLAALVVVGCKIDSDSDNNEPAAQSSTVDLSTLTADYEAKNGDVLTGTLSGNYKITIADGATILLNGVTINGTDDSNYKWAGITCAGDATIILADGLTNTVKGFQYQYPGILPAVGYTLTIKGTGSLDVRSNVNMAGYGGAGIGGGPKTNSGSIDCGNIVIQGGTITATGSSVCAGIGSGYRTNCGSITISGGTVTATAGDRAAGIGSGAEGNCGNITITDGVTKVTVTKGSGSPNSIGVGYEGSCGTVTIGGVEGAISESPYTYEPGERYE